MNGRRYLGYLLGIMALCLSACPTEPEREYPSAAPSGVVASVEGTTVTVSWQPVSGASTYTVYRSFDESSYRFMATLSSVPYFDTGLAPGTYYYKVSGTNHIGEGELSSYIAVTVSRASGGGEEPTVHYTVTFDADGGSPATQTKTVTGDASVGASNMPSEPTKNGYTFVGWYTSTNSGGSRFTGATTVTADITVYAQWTETMMPTISLQAALNWLDTNAVEGGEYTITLRDDEAIAPRELSYSGKNVSLTLTGGSTERTVSLSSDGSLFTVGDSVTLRLDNNLTLQGRSNNTGSLVRVNSGGTLEMATGSKMSGNTSSQNGGGVYVYSGMFTMSGGAISDNTASQNGGGVCISGGGMFTMSGGAISGNTASSFGGGVGIFGGTFTMSGGTISDNTASSSSGGGGGVYVTSGTGATFTKQSGGTIYGSNAGSTLKNTATNGNGHAVYVHLGSNKRNTTAYESTALDSTKAGIAGGWE